MTDTEIVNMAFDQLGETPIAALSDQTETGLMANRQFWANVDQLLTEHAWRFAKVRTAALAPDLTAPEGTEFSHRFALPTDPFCLRVLGLLDEDPREAFSVEGRFLLANLAAPKLLYLGRILDMNAWHPLFVSALVFRLAARFARVVTESTDVVRENWGLYADELRKARHVNAIESPLTRVRTVALTEVR